MLHLTHFKDKKVMEKLKFHYTVEVAVAFTGEEVAALYASMIHHYDRKVQDAALLGGWFRGQIVRACLAPEANFHDKGGTDASMVAFVQEMPRVEMFLSGRHLDTLCKAVEMNPSADKLVGFALRQTLRAIGEESDRVNGRETYDTAGV